MAATGKRRLWIFDIEGTLTGPRGRGMQAAVIVGIRQAMRSGCLVGVNSGRELNFCRSVHQLFDLNGPVIAESGCGWWQPLMGELSRGVCLHRLSDEVREKIRVTIREAGLADRVWEDWRKEYVSTWYPYAFNQEQRTDVDTVYEAIAAALAKETKKVVITRSSEAVDITLAGIDKGSGLREVCAELGVPLEAVGYVGDSWNDWPALSTVLVSGGRGVMMGTDKKLRQQVEHLGGEVLEEASVGLARWMMEEFSFKGI